MYSFNRALHHTQPSMILDGRVQRGRRHPVLGACDGRIGCRCRGVSKKGLIGLVIAPRRGETASSTSISGWCQGQIAAEKTTVLFGEPSRSELFTQKGKGCVV